MTFGSVRAYRLLTWLLPVLIVVACRGLLLDRAAAVGNRLRTFRSLSERIDRTGIHVRQIPEMKNDFERLALKKMEIATSLLGKKSEASLYALIMATAQEAGVAVTVIVPRQERVAEGFLELPLSIEAAGTYGNLARFTGALENVGRIMRVEELAFEKERSGRLTESLRLLVYLYSDTLGGAVLQKGKPAVGFQNREEYLADLTEALRVSIGQSTKMHAFETLDDPFGAAAPAPAGAAQAAQAPAPAKEPPGLTLKGILWKEPPLAILESLDGRTFIVRQGDSAAGFRITSITRAEVTISSPQGTHVLHQYERR
jgi:Tfp pilus assembly protein PilO